MQILRWLGFAVGVQVVAGTIVSVVVTLIVPRGLRPRLTSAAEVAVARGYSRMTGWVSTWERQDRLLALLGPLQLMIQLGVWLLLLLAGYTLMFWPLVGDLPRAILFAGSSMFTLGIATSSDPGPVAVTFIAAATGLVAVALQISYLPTIYASYNRRETLVTMLESRGGAPVWGPEILARHALVDIVDNLPAFYADWERWAADVAESHTNYPTLLLFRSPDPLRSWVLALLAVLDAAALHLSLCPSTAPSETRLVLRMGFTALRDIARVMRIDFDPDPSPDDPIKLDEAEFRRAVEHLTAAGFSIERSAEEAWPHFRGWRVNYEGIAWALADRVSAPPGLWSGTRTFVGDRVAPAPRRPVDRRPGGAQPGRAALADEAHRRRAVRAAADGKGGSGGSGRAAR